MRRDHDRTREELAASQDRRADHTPEADLEAAPSLYYYRVDESVRRRYREDEVRVQAALYPPSKNVERKAKP